jgi:tetratricopeptide (TPR) repeat protein
MKRETAADEMGGGEMEDISKRKDGSVRKVVVTQGEGRESPHDGATCTVHIIGCHAEGEQFDDRVVTFSLGEGGNHAIPYPVERALTRFKRGELSRVCIRGRQANPGYAWNHGGDVTEEGTDVVYSVELTDFTQVPGHWELSAAERLCYAETFKNKGTELFKAGKYRLAKRYYKKVILYLQHCNVSKSQTDSADRPFTLPSNQAMQDNSNASADPLLNHSSNLAVSSLLSSDSNGDDKDAKLVRNDVERNNDPSLIAPSVAVNYGTSLSSNDPISSDDPNTDGLTQAASSISTIEDETNKTENCPAESTSLRGDQISADPTTKLLLAAYLNLALCYLKLGKNLSAMEVCDLALEINPTSDKGLYRRGLAHLAMDNLEAAVDDLNAVHALDPRNTAVLAQLCVAQQRLAQYHAQQKHVYAGMFTKFAAHDTSKENELNRGRADVFSDIGEWSNELAADMMTLEQEMAAFGEVMPKPRYGKGNQGENQDDKENDQCDSDYD